MHHITGIILCGGKNSRMGKNKALLKIASKTIIEHIIETLEPLCDEILISTNSIDLDFLPQPKVPDIHQNIGPIAGFQSTLLRSKTDKNIIVSCDTPFITTSLLSHLIKNSASYDVVLPSYNKHLQPMIGYFNKNFVKIINQHINSGKTKPIQIFENANMLKVEITSKLPFYHPYLFFNINTKNEYEEAKRIHKSISG